MIAAIFNPSLVTQPQGAAAPPVTHAWKDGSFGFHDVLDTINPLQHIPVISSIYRWLTGDVPGNVARIVGDGIYGGPIGLVAGTAAVAFKERTGHDPGEMAIALIAGPGHDAPETAIAAAKPPSQPPATIVATAKADETPADVAPPLPAAPPPTATAQSPLPLVKSAAAVPQSALGHNPAEAAFLAQTAAQNAALQRSFVGKPAAAATGRPVTAPIPLQLTGTGLPIAARRPPSAVDPVSPAGIAPAPSPSAPDNPPVEISQRMLEALDKYMQLQHPRGSTVDLVQ